MVRRFGLIHATALNMTNMIGIGPFITIPLLMSALGGPQAMLGWLVALVIVISDSMVWSELGAAMPGSGGSFGYLRQGYGAETVGRLMGFLFVWQFVLSGPLEIASGYIGFSQYLGYLWKGITARQTILVVTIIGLANLALLYRRIKSIATIPLALSIIGLVPWRDFVPAGSRRQSKFIVSLFMERMYGPGVATMFTTMVLWTAFGSVFALLLGYSRVPYAAAKDGYFFKVFARLHPSGGFPYVSLIVLGVLSIFAGFVSLGMVIDALITTRILVQFIGQIGAVTLLRRRAPDLPRPYRMWLYPVPSLIALLGWIFIFATTPPMVIAFGLGALLLGVVCFAAWSWKRRTWPFETSQGAGSRI